MKNQTDNSLFVEVKEDEAANVNGGTMLSDMFGNFLQYQANYSPYYSNYRAYRSSGYDSIWSWGFSLLNRY